MRSRTAWTTSLIYVILIGLFYLYVGLLVNPQLLYQQHGAVFVATSDFLKSFLDHPGGPAQYVSRVLCQFCWFRWVGALVLTLTALLVCVSTRGLLRAAAGRAIHPMAAVIPALLLFMLYGQYQYRVELDLSLLAALGAAFLYVRLPWRNALVRGTVLIVLSCIVYYLAGGAVIVFGLLCALVEVLRGRRYAVGFVGFVVAAALPFAFAAYSFVFDVEQTLLPLLPAYQGKVLTLSALLTVQTGIHLTLLLFFPAATAWAALWGRKGEGAPETPAKAQTGMSAPPPGWTARSLGMLVVAAALLTYFTLDVGAGMQIEIAVAARERNWDGVLKTAGQLPAECYDEFVVHEVNRALYHVGGLPSDMFCYPQKRGAPSILPTRDTGGGRGYMKHAELTLEIGHVNYAQRYAHQALECLGPHPEVLKLLIRSYIAQGRKAPAITFLNALHKNPLYRGWADEFRSRLEQDSVMAMDEVLCNVKDVKLARDESYGASSEGEFSYLKLLQQLQKGKKPGRMAFEYMMALYLLQRRADKIVEDLPRARKFGYEQLPRLWEEAVLYYQRTNPDKSVDLHGWTISPDTQRRFALFAADLKRHHEAAGTDVRQAFTAMAGRWGSTYFYYALMGYSEPRPGWKVANDPAKEGTTK